MKVIIIGATGQLGTEIVQAYQDAGSTVVALTHDDLDVANLDSARAIFTRTVPDLVINTAAFHQLEKCEADPAESFSINALGARNLACLSNEHEFKLVHISTDYVFDGGKASPYHEDDCPKPLNVYGNTKLSGEHFVRTIAAKHFIVRVSALFGRAPCRAKGGMNFPQLMLHLARTKGKVRVVDDEFVSPTYTVDAAKQIVLLATTAEYGVYHCTSEGSCSWYDLAKRTFDLSRESVVLEKAGSGEFPMKVPRPKYSVLENSALKSMGINQMPAWEDALERYLTTMSS